MTIGRRASIVRNRRVGLLWPLAALVVCGCWEEIRYEPPPEPPETVAESVSAEVEEPVVIEADSQPATSEPLVLEELPVEEPPAVDEPVVELPASAESPAAPAPAKEPPSPDERLQAWLAASRWSLAMALYAKGLDASRHEPLRAEAAAAAAAIGVELPPLPTAEPGTEVADAVIQSLGEDAGPALADLLGKRLGPAEQAAASLAIQSHRWLLSYSPRDEETATDAAAVREAALASELPAELWAPLVKLVDKRAGFLAVRAAIFDMHRRTEAHLKAAAESESASVLR